MNFTKAFVYNHELIHIAPQGIVSSLIAIGIFIGLIFIGKIIYTFIIGWILVQKDQKMMHKKQSMLSDLILMRDIQTELEKEIEQATLKAAFQS